jgi:prophage maintenance system killer protein
LTIYLELGDYCEIAAELLGTSPEQIARLPRIALADSALAAPRAGFGDQDAYPALIEKAAVLVEHLARNHPLPDGNKRAAFLCVWLFLESTDDRSLEKMPTKMFQWWRRSPQVEHPQTKSLNGWGIGPSRAARERVRWTVATSSLEIDYAEKIRL